MTDLLQSDVEPTSIDRRHAADPTDGTSRPGAVGDWIGRRGDLLLALALGVVASVSRIPFQSEFLVNFDAVNFALGVEGFDLAHHEPHPPGYLGYVVLARLVDLVLDDVNRSLTTLSVVATGVFVTSSYWLIRRMASRTSTVVVTLLLAAAPLTWYYGTVALSYLPGAALAVVLVLACHRARVDRDERALFAVALLLALLGALRQTDIVLYLPLAVWCALVHRPAVRLRAGAVAVAASALWLVPLLVLSGGPAEYLDQSRDLAELAGGRTAVFGLDVGGTLRNFRLVGTGLVAGTFGMLALVPAARWRGQLRGDRGWFLGLWAAPSLAVFLLVHTGQLGYVLPIVPAAALVLAGGLDRWRGTVGARSGTRTVVALVGVGLVLDLFALGLVPGWVLERARDDRGLATPIGVSIPLPPEQEIRPLDLRANDVHWREVVERAERSDPLRTTILALPNTSVSFRHLSFYLSDHVVHAVGRGRDGDWGHLFTAIDRETDYSVNGLRTPERVLQLRPTVTQVLFFDVSPEIVDTRLAVHWERLGDGSRLLRLDVAPGSALVFGGGSGDELSISVREPS